MTSVPTNTPTATPTPTAPVTLTPTATPTAMVLLHLGNLVWYDRNNNGLVDSGEPGIPGVTVQLFREGDEPGTYNRQLLMSATPVATDVTDAQGLYLFENLQPGRYFVYIPTPLPLYPMSSTSTDTADNREDNDDNGSQSTLAGPVRSPVIELTVGDGANGDLTIDFGFWQPQPDLVLVKQVGTSPSLIQSGVVVTYSLVYSNVGPGIAVGVILTETVSAHATYALQASTPGWSCADGAAAGTKCIFALGNILPGQHGEVRFAVRVDANTGSGTAISNVAVIGANITQLEAENLNNQDNADIVIQSPTNLPEGDEPTSALPLRLYLPIITN